MGLITRIKRMTELLPGLVNARRRLVKDKRFLLFKEKLECRGSLVTMTNVVGLGGLGRGLVGKDEIVLKGRGFIVENCEILGFPWAARFFFVLVFNYFQRK